MFPKCLKRILDAKESHTNTKYLSRLIQERREQLGLSLKDLSARAQLDAGYLSRIQSGQKAGNLSADSLQRLANALELPLGVLHDQYAPADLPPLPIYLRRMYGMADDDIARLERYLDHLDLSSGPAPGEDEIDTR